MPKVSHRSVTGARRFEAGAGGGNQSLEVLAVARLRRVALGDRGGELCFQLAFGVEREAARARRAQASLPAGGPGDRRGSKLAWGDAFDAAKRASLLARMAAELEAEC